MLHPRNPIHVQRNQKNSIQWQPTDKVLLVKFKQVLSGILRNHKIVWLTSCLKHMQVIISMWQQIHWFSAFAVAHYDVHSIFDITIWWDIATLGIVMITNTTQRLIEVSSISNVAVNFTLNLTCSRCILMKPQQCTRRFLSKFKSENNLFIM